jgi:hypothetical protein
MLVSLTVGKVDAGVAVLLTEDKRLVSPLNASQRPAQRKRTLQFILADVELDRVPLHIATPGHLVWLYGGH